MDFDLTQVIQCEDENDEEIIESERPVSNVNVTSSYVLNVCSSYDAVCTLHIL